MMSRSGSVAAAGPSRRVAALERGDHALPGLLDPVPRLGQPDLEQSLRAVVPGAGQPLLVRVVLSPGADGHRIGVEVVRAQAGAVGGDAWGFTRARIVRAHGRAVDPEMAVRALPGVVWCRRALGRSDARIRPGGGRRNKSEAK
jgi:hypothetical protein